MCTAFCLSGVLSTYIFFNNILSLQPQMPAHPFVLYSGYLACTPYRQEARLRIKIYFHNVKAVILLFKISPINIRFKVLKLHKLKASTIHFSKSLFFAILILFVFMAGCVQLNNSKPNGGDEKDMYDGPGLAAQFEFDRTKDPATGRVPREKYLLALEKTIQSKNENASAIGGLPWIERGPDSDMYGPFGNSRANNDITSGRIRAVMVDSSDATHKTVFIGGVCGGLWKTTDITASPATWSVINDNLSNLAIAAICQDPRPGFQNIMYFCTGESYYNADGVQGNGVFKSTDFGATWTYLPSTSTFVNGTRILCDYLGNIYLATRGTGLLRSTAASGGAAWTTITPSSFPNSDITDMEISSTSVAGRLHITCGTVFSANGYRFTDIPVTVTAAAGWTSSTTSLPSFTNRIEIACSGNTLYALPANNNPTNQVPIIYKSTDGGVNWATTGGVPSATWASGQGWYALAIDIDPSNANSCIIGGLDTWKTTNAGANWTQLSTWVGSSPVAQYVHADVHKILWLDGGNKLIVASDGGIFYSPDKGVTFRDRNKDLRLKQFYSCAIHPSTTNYFLAGAQDNGVHQFTNAGLSSTTEVNGGDGCYVAIDQLVPANQFGSYVFNAYNRSTDGGTNWAGVNFYKGRSGSGSNFGSFINAWDYDNTNKIIYAGGDAGEFFRWTTALTTPSNNYFATTGFPAGASILSSITNFSTGKVTAVTVSPFTANRVYFGTNQGKVVYIDGANTAASGTAGTNITGVGFPVGATVSCINAGTNDLNLICCLSNYGVNSIFVTTNGGVNWTSLDNNGVNLADMPVRWCMFYPGDNTKAFIATETGVWQTDLISGATTVWNANPNFPAVRTDMIKYRSSDRTIAAATHGRGLWTAIVPAAATPDLSFQSATDATTEGTSFTSGCRGYTDYTKYMVISNTPTGAATVTLSVAGGGTATQGVDYDITTNGNFTAPSVVLNFASGSGTAQPFTIRVYDDAAVESAENFTLNYATAGGNAQPGATNQTFTFTTNDNDATPTANGTFSNAVGTYNANATAQAPFHASQAKYRIQALFTLAELNAAGITGTRNFTSMTLRVVTKNSTLPFTNFTISMANSGATNLSTGFQNAAFTSVFPAANYSTAAGDNLFNFGTPFAWDGTSNILINFCYDNAAAGTSDVVEVQSPFVSNLTAYSNAVASSPCTAPALSINAARIKATFGTTVTGTPVSTALNSTKTTYLGPNDDAYFYNGSGNIIARIKNLTAFDYGCTQIIIDRAGSSSAQFWNNATANYLLSKTCKVIPTNNTASGSYQITLYYTAAEVAGWEAATGRTWAASTMQVVKVSNGFFVPDITPAAPRTADVALVTGTKGTLGSDFTLRGDFSSTGFSGFGAGVPGNALLIADFRTKATGDFTDGLIWQYNNEGAGFVDALQAPASNSNVTIQAAHTVALNGGFTINTGKTVLVNGILNCGTNIINGAGGFTTATGSTLGIGSTAGITSSGATGNIQTTARTFATTGNYTYNGAASQAAGNGLPATINNLVVNNTGAALNNIVTLNGALTVNGSSAFTAGLLAIGANTLTINGAASYGTGTITGSATSNMVIGGTALAQVLNFTAGGRILKDLTLNAGATASLGTALDITAGAAPGTVIVNTGATLITGGNLALRSDDNGTARVGISAGTISGNVIVERNIKNAGHRAWHLLSANTTGSQTIFNAWQEGGVNVANRGTLITSNLFNGTNGFDLISLSSSILTHNQGGAGGPSWNSNLANTNTTIFSSFPGYMLFVRGDRNYTSTLPTPTATNQTVLKSTGGLKQGTQAGVTVSALGTGRTLVGNPYASAIDMDAIFTGTANLNQDMMIWDPTLTGSRGVGGFRLVERNGGAYQQTPVVLGGGAVPDAASRFIHSGQAFFLKATGSNANMVFAEANKTASVSLVNPIVQTQGDQQLFANLMVVEPGNKASLADGLRIRYNASYQAGADDDIEKMGNFGENISVYRAGKKWIVEKRPMIGTRDTIFMRMSNTAIKYYRFEIGTLDFVQSNVKAYLEDTYLKTVTALDISGGVTYKDFSITSDAASANPDRFRIIFSAANPSTPIFTGVKAVEYGHDVMVSWKVSNELLIQKYEVEHSTDGLHFTKVNSQVATGITGSNVSYNWLHLNPVTGDNFYRIKSIGIAGDEKISDVVKVKIGKGNPAITVYPNPVKDHTIALHFTNMKEGVYRLRIFNAMGQLVFTRTINHAGGTATQTVVFDRGVTKGNYRLEFIKPDNTTTTQAILITE